MEEVLSGNSESSVVSPTNAVSFVSVVRESGFVGGPVTLQYKTPGGDWRQLGRVYGAKSLSTPDTSVQYKFVTPHMDGSVRCYFA